MDPIELCRSLEAGLRAGYSVRQALERTAADAGDPGLAAIAARATDGEPLPRVLDAWQAAFPDHDLVIAAIRLQLEDSGNLADKLGFLGRVLERR
jgi:Flp pilus assembly protein TadB